jgi:hypothetical protein
VLSIALLTGLACLAQQQTATLTGAVTSLLGTPVVHAEAQLESEDGRGLRFSVETDNAGRFQFEDVPSGTYRLEVNSPYLSYRKRGIVLLGGQRKSLPQVILAFERCGDPSVDSIQRLAMGDDSSTLRGSVLDNSGTPVSGAVVSLNCDGCVTKTNWDGQFAFSKLKPEPGNYTVSVSMMGFYREFSPNYFVYKNLDWTYAPIQIERCPAEGCERTPRQEKIVPRCE